MLQSDKHLRAFKMIIAQHGIKRSSRHVNIHERKTRDAVEQEAPSKALLPLWTTLGNNIPTQN